MLLIAFTVAAALVTCALAGLLLERAYVIHEHLTNVHIRSSDRVQLWVLRGVGVWFVFCLLYPIVVLAQETNATIANNAQQIANNAQQIMLNNQSISSIEARIAQIESLRLDARLSLLEDTRRDVQSMSQEVRGIIGGLIVMVGIQVLGLLGKQRDRKNGRSNDG